MAAQKVLQMETLLVLMKVSLLADLKVLQMETLLVIQKASWL